MGIEPTRDLFKPRAGFEDQERHQAALHLHVPEPRIAKADFEAIARSEGSQSPDRRAVGLAAVRMFNRGITSLAFMGYWGSHFNLNTELVCR